MIGAKKMNTTESWYSRISSYSDPILIPRIITLKPKNVLLTQTLIRKEGSRSFSQNLIPKNWEKMQNKPRKMKEKGKIKSHWLNCVPGTLNWVQKFWKIFAENPFDNLKST